MALVLHAVKLGCTYRTSDYFLKSELKPEPFIFRSESELRVAKIRQINNSDFEKSR